ncbi:ATP-dependent DNA helicase RecG [Candidatus Uhrbacteria bacterium CG_4_9_14_0_2_um_filter_41_50]|uniref:Probable DNA 3'-5' helicase RecG n=1 Tax=Candidatus Uhrbacteria bacterium CG_4_9_14_0_2_um_filter_41_50 TaxID=1975031 RepID=A0A2M8EPH8_9BACT|nr:MAG: ATP-dependent DNA helicase RecG [Candidatus Uhrbacteria bacterium CG_4_10_14_3_um_filter_41_21]PIZ54878.1 MAG: ATP-dependent DNA helicase RecG [Candidatus Uhrbacteria bacterium CG_4_10_14_0_2_um_filter_41_21]PJB84716.1 MAG: ATP-dependent DNA helicase RecG [Candidatus Uhrbacteria bacterium CG_4_9_14_0_8_um_filter_41_16]PJC24632.1 MAG: ATP-dependent DNA helicase RecG [Candidatus Uhrbacteria bacterium CG_4_9_14_0_2_um_filter_41_50]PJE75404.1 MAG: ATP-dependent DNA helicase RecG [Candidatus
MSILEKEVRYCKGVGVTKARDFARLGVETLKDALFDFPFRHDDLSNRIEISNIKSGEKVTVRGTIALITNRRSKNNNRMIVTEAIVEDGSGSVKAIWFHQGFLTKVLKNGSVVSLSGKVDDKYGLFLVNPMYEVIGNGNITKHTGRIVPIYSLTGGLTQKVRRSVAESSLEGVYEVKDWLPGGILKDEHFVSLHTALSNIHFPNKMEEYEVALERLKFNEFFLHQILHGKARRELKQKVASKIPFSETKVKEAIAGLPFKLTNAQKKALWAVVKDMERTEPMNRLLEGDVGTGKTIVAALAAINATASGWQSAILAPTEILADQHAMSLNKMFAGQLTIAVFTRTKRRVGEREVTKKQMLDALANGKIDLVIGTHALLSDNVLFNRLGLIVVDEQHRFGVKQRQALKDRQGDEDGIPHLLSMTATPIPRSLALVLYGDLDRSLLDEYPEGRQTIDTFIVTRSQEEKYYQKMRDQIDAGQQVFVVCPLIEESDALGVQSVTEVYNNFVQGPFAAYNIGVLHGKLKAEEKNKIMAQFVACELDMLISTTVIEVGVDIPNATVMFIEGAERFGLAQLHQLRGRVGRGECKSFCFLHLSGDISDLAKQRLQAVVNSQNGFDLADKDLKLRGPGNIFGTDQSGFEAFKLGSYADIDLISKACDYAKDYLDEDPDLDAWPALKERVLEYIDEIHFE